MASALSWSVSLAIRALKWLPRGVRERLLRGLIAFRPDEVEGVTVGVAVTVEELTAASSLLHEAYVARGLTAPHPSRLRVTPHMLLPTTMTFVARQLGRVVATMSLILDGPLGLPMESLCPGEVGPLRSRGRRLAEVGALCVAEGFRRRGITVLLNKLMWRCAVEIMGVDDLLIAVHPEAEDVYHGVLGFHSIGAVGAYPGLQKRAPALSMHLDLRTMPDDWREQFGTKVSVSNPYHVFFRMEHEQIRMPAPNFPELARTARLAAARVLARACPDAVTQLAPPARRYLSSLLPGSILPFLPSGPRPAAI